MVQAFAMFRQGASVDEGSQHTGRARSTGADYLAEFIAAERPASIAAWVPENVYRQVATVTKQINTDRLKPVFGVGGRGSGSRDSWWWRIFRDAEGGAVHMGDDPRSAATLVPQHRRCSNWKFRRRRDHFWMLRS